MNNPNDTEMFDSHDSSGFLDDTRSETISLVDRPKGSTLRQRHHQEVNESPADYADLFRALQIRPESHERFLNGVLKVLRQKNIKELQGGTDAKIRHLSWLVLRGYRSIIWKEGSEWLLENGERGSKWLLEDDELEDGEERLLHGGDNERFYPLLEPIWWRMRELVFEPKPPPKSRVGRKKTVQNVGGGVEDAYEADNDTELDIRPPHNGARDQMLRKINKQIADTPEPISSSSSRRHMLADETDKAIVDIVVRLADTRARSDPDIFQRLWDQHIGRVDELEINRSGVDRIAGPRRTPHAAVSTAPSLSNEPFATEGNPARPSWPRALPAQVPAVLAVYITTAPPESPYTQKAYEWPDAPVRMVDQNAFYNGLLLRVNMKAERVKGLAMSYGWCDVCRWIAKGTAGEREGWVVLQSDLAWAAERGVRVWRMKLLLVGCQ